MIGILGGTSFFSSKMFLDGIREKVITAYGSCEVIINENIVTIPRHGIEKHIPPHMINHHAHLKAFEQLGVDGIVAFGSVGSLKKEIMPGTQMLIKDIYSPFKTVTYSNDRFNYLIPELDKKWSQIIKNRLTDSGVILGNSGVYAETNGPRFESKTEIKALAKVAEVVGMTCASEAVLAMELNIPLAILATIDNWANGINAEALTAESFKMMVESNRDKALKALEAVSSLS
jgi:5'-methylthioinosine phosphorylase